MIQKTIDAKFKAYLQSLLILWNIDLQASYGQQYIKPTKSSEEVKIKDLRIDKLKIKSQPPAFQQSKKVYDKAKKERKKD